VILAYRHFCDLVDKNGGDAKKDCVLYMHTSPSDNNGTDLFAVINELCRDYPVAFSEGIASSEALNVKYNVADVVINMASNEGFGLGTAEALSTGTPIVVNVTGGLQDQCGFINPKTNGYFTAEDYIEIHTLHRKDIWGDIKHGEWVKPVWPSNISLQGSVPTPYIFDDRADFRDVGTALYEWYTTKPQDRRSAGLKGREYIMNEEVGMSRDLMSERVIESINTAFENFKPRNRFDLTLV
jgi:glycosyltransferase involved in cell wall biosynthesis